MLASLIFAAAMATATPAVAPTDVAAVSESNKVVCKTEETTGTRLGSVRVCMTKAQWDDRAAADGHYLQQQQGRGFQH